MHDVELEIGCVPCYSNEQLKWTTPDRDELNQKSPPAPHPQRYNSLRPTDLMPYGIPELGQKCFR